MIIRKVQSPAMVLVVALAAAVGLAPMAAHAHCQIPCGIYGDQTRFDMLREHITTIEKAMNQVDDLSANAGANANQLVRWVNNKEEHADKFAHIIEFYFLQQRIKPKSEGDGEAYSAYLQHLELCHKMLVTVMKCKQTTDLAHIGELRSLVDAFEDAYMSAQEAAHKKAHEEGSAHNKGSGAK